ncbi:IPT/TIG domain-containing protein [Rudanella lutea]|uniref:IPT/TIG domain-containing protein n=1 Tax=Rudanella lutea TaxID=451374 RepID=UPI00146D9C91|nr:IPT/TIG domain-containing protein [Rudanella lutea]
MGYWYRLVWMGLVLMGALSGCRVQKYPPELTQALPSTSPIGQEITLTGYQFGDEPTVHFGREGTFVQAQVSDANDQVIKVTVPRMPIGATQIRVTNEQGVTDPVAFTVNQPMPVITSITPTNALPGERIVIQGDYLDQLRWVGFGVNGVNSVENGTPQSITVTVPAGVTRGPQQLEVETIGGRVSRPFLVAGVPQITSFAPRRPRLSEEVSVQGRNLLDGVVLLNGLRMPLTRNTDTELRFTVPANATSGRIAVTLYDQLTAVSADTLLLALVPTIDPGGFSITEGVRGDRLLITGRNLRDVSSVTLGGTPATFRALNDTQLEVILPERQQAGNVFLALTNLGGSITSTQPFLYYNAPADLTFSPTRAIRGREIVVNGQSLFRITGATVNGRPAPITSRIEGSEVKFAVPADATTGPIMLTNRAGTATSSRSLTVVLRPVISTFTQKAIVGSRVVLTGAHLLNAQVFFTGSQGAAPSDGRNTDSELWVRVSNDAQTGPIRVVNEAGETLTTSFTALRAPAGIAFGPDRARPGTDITVTGSNLTDATEVRFGNGRSSAARFRVSGQSLIVTVPADATDGAICVTNDAGTVCSVGSFFVIAPITNFTFAPTSSSVGGSITITAASLQSVREVRFNNGRSSAAPFRMVGQTLVVTVPPDAQTGPICLINDGGTGCSTQNFTLIPPPANLALSVTAAAVGAEVIITGANLSTTREVRFTNGRSSAATFRVLPTTPASLSVTVPTDAANGPICITNSGGEGCTAVSFTVR